MRRKEITRLLDDWNPIGADGLPEDEYDCLVEKIELWLDEGHEMSEFEFLLESFLGDHFRLDVDPDAITEFTSELDDEDE
jgi:hypothetical protein